MSNTFIRPVKVCYDECYGCGCEDVALWPVPLGGTFLPICRDCAVTMLPYVVLARDGRQKDED